MAGDDSGSGGLGGGVLRDEQSCVHGVAIVGDPVDLLDLDLTEVGLDHAREDAGDQHQDDAGHEDDVSLGFCHLDFPSVSDALL